MLSGRGRVRAAADDGQQRAAAAGLELAAGVARGYRWTGAHQEPLDYRFTYASPSGAVAASAADMGRLMLVLLGDGSGLRAFVGIRWRAERCAVRVRPAPLGDVLWFRPPAVARPPAGLSGGTLGDQAAMFFLLETAGCLRGVEFVFAGLVTFSSRHDDASFGAAVPSLPLLTPGPGARERGALRGRLSRLPSHPQRHVSSAGVDADDRVAGGDGTRRCAVVAGPAVGGGLASCRCSGVMALSITSCSATTGAVRWPICMRAGGTYERIGWLEQTVFHGVLLVACVVAFVSYAVSPAGAAVPPRFASRRRRDRTAGSGRSWR